MNTTFADIYRFDDGIIVVSYKGYTEYWDEREQSALDIEDDITAWMHAIDLEIHGSFLEGESTDDESDFYGRIDDIVSDSFHSH